jgi:hypothetical protein
MLFLQEYNYTTNSTSPFFRFKQKCEEQNGTNFIIWRQSLLLTNILDAFKRWFAYS